MIKLNGVTKVFGDTVAVNDLSFEIKKGATVGILGPNGSGKTTTMRLISGMIDCDEGEISVFGKDPVKFGDEIRGQIGVVTENAALYGYMTGRKNLEFFCELYGVKNKSEKISELVEFFEMESYIDKKLEGYSTGMKKRLAVAKAILNDPQLLLLDEPTSGLDPESARDILLLVESLSKKDVTILLCTHNLNEAQQVCDDYIFLDHGVLKAHDSLSGLKAKYGDGEIIVFHMDMHGGKFEELKVDDISQVPGAISEFAKNHNIYGAHLKGDDLSEIYFKIREEK